MCMMNDLEANYEYFQWRYDARGSWCVIPIQNCTMFVRILAYGYADDAQDKYLKMSEKTVWECVYTFYEYAIDLHTEIYL